MLSIILWKNLEIGKKLDNIDFSFETLAGTIIGGSILGKNILEPGIKNHKWSSFICMEELRKERGEYNLSYMDLPRYGRKEFDEKVKQFEKENPIPKFFHDLFLQKDFYSKEGVFKSMTEEEIDRIFKDIERRGKKAIVNRYNLKIRKLKYWTL